MKRRFLVIVGFSLVLAAATITFLRVNSEISTAAKPRPTIVAANGMKLSTNTDPVDVFRRAFWRHPTDDDQILNAERREWTGKGGVQKWQWFIAVRPGSQLLDWLEKNPFSMKLATSPVAIESPPVWYPQSTENFQVYANAEGGFILMLSADRKHLYATDSGLGFTAPGEAP